MGGCPQLKAKNLKGSMKPKWNFHRGRGGGSLRKSPHGGGMDIFWYCTLFIILARNKQNTNKLVWMDNGEMHMLRSLSSVWMLCRAKYPFCSTSPSEPASTFPEQRLVIILGLVQQRFGGDVGHRT